MSLNTSRIQSSITSLQLVLNEINELNAIDNEIHGLMSGLYIRVCNDRVTIEPNTIGVCPIPQDVFERLFILSKRYMNKYTTLSDNNLSGLNQESGDRYISIEQIHKASGNML